MPPRKPDVRRQDTRTVRAGAGLALVQATAVVPAAPAGLLVETRDAWAVFWGSELAARLVLPTDRPAVRRLFTLYDERARALSAYRAERLTTGSTGQLVLSPMAKMIQVCDGEIRQLEDRFGLTPLSRLRLGVTLGEAARSLEELNRSLADDPDEDVDPRLGVVDAAADSS